MRRTLFNLAAAMSLVLLAVVCSLWAVSLTGPRSVTATHVIDRPINVGIGDQRTEIEHSVIVGGHSIAWLRWWCHNGGGAPLGWSMTPERVSSPWARPWQICGFGFAYFNRDEESFGRREVAVPIWLVAAVCPTRPSRGREPEASAKGPPDASAEAGEDTKCSSESPAQ